MTEDFAEQASYQLKANKPVDLSERNYTTTNDSATTRQEERAAAAATSIRLPKDIGQKGLLMNTRFPLVTS